MGSIKRFPELIVIAGPNGSGKTTVTTQFLHHKWSEGVLYINPDQVAEDKFGGWNNPEAIIEAANNFFGFQEALETLLGHKIDITDDSAVQNPYFRNELNETRQLLYGG